MSATHADPDALLGPAFADRPPRVGSFVDRARRHVEQWADELDLVPDRGIRSRFRAADFGGFAAEAYPQADHEGGLLVADWFAWLFVLDDLLDDGDFGRDLTRSADLLDRFLAVLGGTRADTGPAGAPDADGGVDVGPVGTALVRALDELWERTRPRVSQAWQARFRDHVTQGALAAYWEATNRVEGVVPEVETYVERRRHTGAILVCMDLVEAAAGTEIPPDVHDGDEFQAALLAACDVVCWTNDVYSLDKERLHGEAHNLVHIIAHHRRLDDASALTEVCSMITDLVREFDGRAERVRRAHPEHAAALDRCLDGMVTWMRGNLDWSSRTRRYHDLAAEVGA